MKIPGFLRMAAFAAAASFSLAFASLGAQGETEALPYDPAALEAAAEADQMVVVVGTGGSGAQASYLVKAPSGWELQWTETAVVGRNGITQEKREGDGKTPSGTYSFTMAFGLEEDPGTVLDYHAIVPGDYWVDDPESPYYNQLVNTSRIAVDWNSAEDMAAAYPTYNYGLALSYNQDCIPGLGSAIFLHCYTARPDNGSAGCIRLPQERVKELLQSVTSNSRIVIAASLDTLK